MHVKKSSLYDAQRLQSIKDNLIQGATTSDLVYCIDLIEDLYDENQSLWDILDEIKASDVKHFTDALERASLIAASERYLKSVKPEEA